jgi:hypothetical protein
MDQDDKIVELLTEIRDTLHNESELRMKISQESHRLAQISVKRQQFGLVIIGVVFVVGVALLLWWLLNR